MIGSKTLRYVISALVLTTVACHAQSPLKSTGAPSGSSSAGAPVQAGETLSPDMARRIEVLIRSRSDVPYNYAFHIGQLSKSDIPGFDSATVEFSVEGKTSKPLEFLISKDRTTLAQFTKYDISKDPKTTVSAANRPARGGPSDAPVSIVVFDDLECPFCARSNANLFPALLNRYKNQVRIVYRDFPLVEIHPWAMHAAIDTDCVGIQNSSGYWNLIDYIHAHADEIGGKNKTLVEANETLDTVAREEGKKWGLDERKLAECVKKQDSASVDQSIKEAEALGVGAAPAIFINGEKIEGAQPMEYIYSFIDGALIAAGQTPPPAPVQLPAIHSSDAPAKPGN